MQQYGTDASAYVFTLERLCGTVHRTVSTPQYNQPYLLHCNFYRGHLLRHDSRPHKSTRGVAWSVFPRQVQTNIYLNYLFLPKTTLNPGQRAQQRRQAAAQVAAIPPLQETRHFFDGRS